MLKKAFVEALFWYFGSRKFIELYSEHTQRWMSSWCKYPFMPWVDVPVKVVIYIGVGFALSFLI